MKNLDVYGLELWVQVHKKLEETKLITKEVLLKHKRASNTGGAHRLLHDGELVPLSPHVSEALSNGALPQKATDNACDVA